MNIHRPRTSRSLLCALSLLGACSLPAADELVHYDAKPGSKLKLEGTSTIHDWKMEGQIIGGFLELDKDFQPPSPTAATPKLGKVNARAQASIPVRSLRSGTDRMDEVMKETMKEPQFKRIEYRLTEMVLKPASSPAGPYQFETKGDLTIAGVTNKISMPVTMEALDKTRLKISSSTSLKMTDYGVKPPAPSILGLSPIKTGDDVKVSFEWLIAPQTTKAAEK
jgi:hypothetical protein